MRRAHLTLMVVLAMLTLASSLAAQERRWGEGYLPNATVMTQDGVARRFYDDLVKGKIVVISFMYTNCPDICPLTTARMAQVEEKLGDLVGRDIFFISMTVDPEHDTPERLKSFATAFGAGPGWSFVTGKPDEIRAINYRLGDRKQSALSEHRNEIVLGNDATGEWARDTLFGDLDRLTLTIRGMDPKWRDEVHVPRYDPASNTGYMLSSEPGQGLFKKMCAPCHTIGVGDRVGPDLRGVTERRSRAWLAGFIRNPAKARARLDPVAVELATRFPGVRMPNLGISELDAADLIAYLDVQTAKLRDAGMAMPEQHHAHEHQHHEHQHHDHQH